MSNTPNLLPCPFCGGINIIHCGHHMYCHACGADGPDADSQHESEAIAAWNRRTPQLVNLGFTIENRAGADVLVWKEGGCRPATSAEIAMWKALAAVQQPVVREPLSEQDVLGGLMATPNSVLENGADAFEAGVRFAERAHGITQKGGQHVGKVD